MLGVPIRNAVDPTSPLYPVASLVDTQVKNSAVWYFARE